MINWEFVLGALIAFPIMLLVENRMEWDHDITVGFYAGLVAAALILGVLH
jgi:hypothetical protein